MLSAEKIPLMDSAILLSLVNMKLRNEFSSLESLCRNYAITPVLLEQCLLAGGFAYQPAINQFRPNDLV